MTVQRIGTPSPLDLVAAEIAEKTRLLIAEEQERKAREGEQMARLSERPALRLDEAAQLIGVSRQFLASYVKRGDLPTIKLGATLRLILREDLDAWLRAHRVGDVPVV